MTMNVDAGSNEPVIVMTRTFEAPRDVVWRAFTEPEHVERWYGGHGFGNEVREMDVRPGGHWKHVMKTPDGTAFELEYEYVEVVRPERIAWKSLGWGKAPPPPGQLNVLNTITLEAAGKRTHWKLVARFESVAERDHASKMGFSRVIAQGSEKLDELVQELAAKAVAS